MRRVVTQCVRGKVVLFGARVASGSESWVRIPEPLPVEKGFFPAGFARTGPGSRIGALCGTEDWSSARRKA